MAPPENDPLHTSSGEVELSSEEEEVSESESERGQAQKYTVKPSSSAASSKPTADPSKSSSSLGEEEDEEDDDDDDESGSDSGSESKRKSYSSHKKPIAPVSPAKLKRPASAVVSEGDAVVESKRAKMSKNDDTETETGTKKQLFQRLWTEEDEIAVLQGMINYSSEKNADPLSYFPEFYNSVKKSLSIDVSSRQLKEKVRRMRIKYENNAKKTKNGKEKTLSKAHERACYVLSKKIWGNDGIMSSVGFGSPKINKGTAKKVQSQIKSADVIAPWVDIGLKEAAPMENMDNVHGLAKRVLGRRASIGLWGTPEEYVKKQWKLFAGSKKIEWEKKRKKVMLEEIEAYVKCTELAYLKAKLVLEAMKSPEERTVAF